MTPPVHMPGQNVLGELGCRSAVPSIRAKSKQFACTLLVRLLTADTVCGVTHQMCVPGVIPTLDKISRKANGVVNQADELRLTSFFVQFVSLHGSLTAPLGHADVDEHLLRSTGCQHQGGVHHSWTRAGHDH